ncbi:UNVERIFIED_CONTAM: hypothetical protein RMT77_019886 [Armadillidium vulgare]
MNFYIVIGLTLLSCYAEGAPDNILSNIQSLVNVNIDLEINQLEECGLSPYNCSTNSDCKPYGHVECKTAPPKCAARHPNYCGALAPVDGNGNNILSGIQSLVNINIDIEVKKLEKYGLSPYYCDSVSDCTWRGYQVCKVAPPQCKARHTRYCAKK